MQLPHKPAEGRVRYSGRRLLVAAGPEIDAGEAAGSLRDQQDPGPQTVAPEQVAHRGERVRDNSARNSFTRTVRRCNTCLCYFQKLTKGDDNWSLAEVVHAIVLLAHFHSLSSFVFSCGINEELDNVTGHHYKENKDNSSNIPPAKDKLTSSPKKIPNGDGKTGT